MQALNRKHRKATGQRNAAIGKGRTATISAVVRQDFYARSHDRRSMARIEKLMTAGKAA